MQTDPESSRDEANRKSGARRGIKDLKTRNWESHQRAQIHRWIVGWLAVWAALFLVFIPLRMSATGQGEYDGFVMGLMAVAALFGMSFSSGIALLVVMVLYKKVAPNDFMFAGLLALATFLAWMFFVNT